MINILVSFQVTDSPYVVASMGIMTRMGTPVLKKLAEGVDYVRCQHSVGRPLPLKGTKSKSLKQVGLSLSLLWITESLNNLRNSFFTPLLPLLLPYLHQPRVPSSLSFSSSPPSLTLFSPTLTIPLISICLVSLQPLWSTRGPATQTRC